MLTNNLTMASKAYKQENFMTIAYLASLMSNDPTARVGACVVNEEDKLISIGYNQVPMELEQILIDEYKVSTRYAYVKHAVRNAIGGRILSGCTLYVTHTPCSQCAKLISQSGIRKIFCLNANLNGNGGDISSQVQINPSSMQNDLAFLWREHELSSSQEASSTIGRSLNFMSITREQIHDSSIDSDFETGCCIVNKDKKIVSLCYKGLSNDNHIAMNALMMKFSDDLKECTMYLTSEEYPCNECAKAIIQSGIKKIILLPKVEPTTDRQRVAEILFTKNKVIIEREEQVSSLENDQYYQDECDRTNFDQDALFMSIAFVISKQSLDRTKVGACIVDTSNEIIGVGYNGWPNDGNPKDYPNKKSDMAETYQDRKLPYVCHAELNAWVNSSCSNVKNCTIYVTHSPCGECAKLIVKLNIKKVIFIKQYEGKHGDPYAYKTLFLNNGIHYQKMTKGLAPIIDQIIDSYHNN